MPLVDVQAVSKAYPRRAGWRTAQHTVVDSVSFSIEPGETLGLVGESGSGKSTVARMILGLTAPTAGRVLIGGVDPARASAAELHRLRRQMQPVFQDPFAALNPRMTVLDIVTEPWVIHAGARWNGVPTEGQQHADGRPGSQKPDRRARRQQAEALLRQVGLDGSALPRYPHEFSGGQRQRINIARALALRPRLLILDEPVSALDVSVGAQVINLLRNLQRDYGLTYLFISHSMPLVRYLSTRIAVMQHGCLVETGEAVALCASPRQDYTRSLIAATPELPTPAV